MKRYISLAGALLVGTVVANEKAPAYAKNVKAFRNVDARKDLQVVQAPIVAATNNHTKPVSIHDTLSHVTSERISEGESVVESLNTSKTSLKVRSIVDDTPDRDLTDDDRYSECESESLVSLDVAEINSTPGVRSLIRSYDVRENSRWYDHDVKSNNKLTDYEESVLTSEQ
jgi:hypothetical protein